jgi:hypothetical protein
MIIATKMQNLLGDLRRGPVRVVCGTYRLFARPASPRVRSA